MKRTPLYEEHLKLGAKLVEFGGWEMPLNYPTGIIAEHLATRKCAGLFDISHMGRFLMSGHDAVPFLQHVLTNNAAALAPGQAQYTIIPNETGGAVDDAYLYRINEKAYVLVVNASNTEKDWKWLEDRRSKFPRAHMEDYTERMAMLSLQGPQAKRVLAGLAGGVSHLPEPLKNRLATTPILLSDVTMSRTGYAGEPLGFELFVPAEKAAALFAAIVEDNEKVGVIPVGLGARDTLRLEAGLPLYGHELGTDIDGKEIPIYATPAARFAVSFSKLKGEYVGREALLRQFREIQMRLDGRFDGSKATAVVPRVVMPMAITTAGIARAGSPVLIDNAPVGYVTSGTAVPYWNVDGEGVTQKPGGESHNRALCLAYLNADLKKGQKAVISVRDKSVEAIIVERHLDSIIAPYARPLPVNGGQAPRAPEAAESLESLARRLTGKACENTRWRQRSTINLIPSEQSMSPLVKLLSIADPVGRYAEHRVFESLGDADVYYYQGTEFIAAVESELVRRFKDFLHCSQVEVRATSGQMANTVVFSGLVEYVNRLDRRAEPRRLRCIMNHHISNGGHLSAQPIGASRDFISIDPTTERWAAVNFPVSRDNPYRVDLVKTAALLEENRPELIVLGRSLILHPEPIREVTRLARALNPRPVILYDSAHVLGLLGPHFQEPFREGADIVTASTHKTFFGTQRGIIASNIDETSDNYDLWKSIMDRAFPGNVSNHHLGTLLGLLMATYEMNAYGREYQKQVIANAKAFAVALKERGLQVEGDPSAGYTETHQVLVRVGYARGAETANRLEKNNIIVNYQALPDDEGFSASSGLRIGVQEMTRFGMREDDFRELAGYLAEVILRQNDVGRQVSDFRGRFLEMKYCLPAAESQPLIDDLLECICKAATR